MVDPKYRVNWHHEFIAEKLESALHKVIRGEKVRLILELPPRSGKSELATIKFPAWVLGRYPDMPIIVSSYSGDLAADFGLKTRDLMNSVNYQRIFKSRLRADTQAKAKWMTEERGSYTAVGVGGSITGRGFRIGIIDDPVKNREEAESETIRNKIENWYNSTFYTRQDGLSAIILIQTRWHKDDLAGRLIQKAKKDRKAGKKHFDDWEVVKFPAIADNDEKYRKKGEALWPDRFDLDALSNIRNQIGIYDWAALYQQSPISSETQEFKTEYFRYRDLEEVLALETRNFLTIDTAVSKETHAHYTGIVRNFVDWENKWNLIAYRSRLNSMELINTIFALHQKDNYTKIGIEKTAHTLAIKPFLTREMRKRGVFLPIEELSHGHIHKEIRIRGLLPRYQSGSIYHIKGMCDDLEREALSFPQGTYDDTLDAAAYQMQIATSPPRRVRMSKEDKYFYKRMKAKEQKSKKRISLKMVG